MNRPYKAHHPHMNCIVDEQCCFQNGRAQNAVTLLDNFKNSDPVDPYPFIFDSSCITIIKTSTINRVDGDYMRKYLQLILSLLALQTASSAFASDLGINVILSGQVSPGVYGQVEIGDAPRPRVVYEQPRVIVVDKRYTRYEPIYLHVPPSHASHWDNHCHSYNACGRRVYFVKSAEYEPEYRREHDHRDHHDHHRDHHNDHHRDHHNDHHRDHHNDHHRDHHNDNHNNHHDDHKHKNKHEGHGRDKH